MAVKSGKATIRRANVNLTKSRILVHRQCPKRLWLQTYRPDLAEEDDSTIARMNAGTRVGEVARDLYPKGKLIEAKDHAQALVETGRLLSQRSIPIFEAAFEAAGVRVRTDLLLPANRGYRLVEVKSSGGLKDYHVEDASVQAWVAEYAGTNLRKVEVAHIDKSFMYPGKGDYLGLFKHVDVSKDTRSYRKDIPKWIKVARKTLDGKEPDIEIGDHCKDPFVCPFTAHCKSEAGVKEEAYPVEILPGSAGAKLAAILRKKGYGDLRKVPQKLITAPKLVRIWRATKSGKAELDAEAGRKLSALGYPRYYLDFETINSAVPIWAKTRPYAQVPFQWSCHIERKVGKLEHKAFLADGENDPRLALAKSMIRALGRKGPILAYNAGFEKGRIKELADNLPKQASALRAILKRIIDLLPIARDHYYHREMRGSWSIKSVLPTIAPELSYDNLEVADGGMAQEAFAEILHPETSLKRSRQLRKDLLEYCERDTLAMAKVARYFQTERETY